MSDSDSIYNSDDPVVKSIAGAIAVYDLIETPTMDDVTALLSSISDAISSGDITSDNVISVINILLNMLYTNGLSKEDEEAFYTMFVNSTDMDTTLQDLQELLFAYILDVNQSAALSSDVISSTVLPLGNILSMGFFNTIQAIITNSASGLIDYYLYFIQNFPTTNDFVNIDNDSGYTQEILIEFLSDFVNYVDDSSLTNDFENTFLSLLTLFQDINFSNFLTSIYAKFNAQNLVTTFNSYFTYAEKDVIPKDVLFQMREDIKAEVGSNSLSTGDITVEGLVTTVGDVINNDDYSDYKDALISWWQQGFIDYHRTYTNGMLDPPVATYGTTLTLALPGSNSYTTTVTDNFGIWNIPMTAKYIIGLIMGVNPLYVALMEAQGSSTDVNFAFGASFGDDALASDSLTLTYAQLSDFGDSLATYLSWDGVSDDDIDAFTDLYSSTLQSYYGNFMNGVLTYTLTAESDVGSFLSIIMMNLPEYISDPLTLAIAQGVWAQFASIPNLSDNGLNGFSYLQIGIEFLNFMSDYLDKTSLGKLGAYLMGQLSLLQSAGSQKTASTAETTSSMPEQLSTMTQLSIVLGIAGLIIGIGFGEIFSVIGEVLEAVGLAAEAAADAAEAATTTALSAISSAAEGAEQITSTAIASGIKALEEAGVDIAADSIDAGSATADSVASTLAEVAENLGIDDISAFSDAVQTAMTSASEASIDSDEFLAVANAIVKNSVSLAITDAVADAGEGITEEMLTAALDSGVSEAGEVSESSITSLAESSGVEPQDLIDAVNSAKNAITDAGVQASEISSNALTLVEESAGISTETVTNTVSEAATAAKLTTKQVAAGVQAVMNSSGVSSLTGTLDSATESVVESVAEAMGVNSQDLIDAVNTVGIGVADEVGDDASSFATSYIMESVTSSTSEEVVSAAASNVSDFSDAMTEFAGSIGQETFKENFQFALEAVSDMTESLGQLTAEDLLNSTSDIADMVEELGSSVEDNMSTISDLIDTNISSEEDTIDLVADLATMEGKLLNLKDALNSIESLAQDLEDAMPQVLEDTIEDTTSDVEQWWQEVSDYADQFAESAETTLKDSFSTIASVAGVEEETLARAVQEVLDLASETGADLLTDIGTLDSDASAAMEAFAESEGLDSTNLEVAVEQAISILKIGVQKSLSSAVTDSITLNTLSAGIQTVLITSGESSIIETMDAAATTAVESLADTLGVSGDDLVNAVNNVGKFLSNILSDESSDISFSVLLKNAAEAVSQDIADSAAKNLEAMISGISNLSEDSSSAEFSNVANMIQQLNASLSDVTISDVINVNMSIYDTISDIPDNLKSLRAVVDTIVESQLTGQSSTMESDMISSIVSVQGNIGILTQTVEDISGLIEKATEIIPGLFVDSIDDIAGEIAIVSEEIGDTIISELVLESFEETETSVVDLTSTIQDSISVSKDVSEALEIVTENINNVISATDESSSLSDEYIFLSLEYVDELEGRLTDLYELMDDEIKSSVYDSMSDLDSTIISLKESLVYFNSDYVSYMLSTLSDETSNMIAIISEDSSDIASSLTTINSTFGQLTLSLEALDEAVSAGNTSLIISTVEDMNTNFETIATSLETIEGDFFANSTREATSAVQEYIEKVTEIIEQLMERQTISLTSASELNPTVEEETSIESLLDDASSINNKLADVSEAGLDEILADDGEIEDFGDFFEGISDDFENEITTLQDEVDSEVSVDADDDSADVNILDSSVVNQLESMKDTITLFADNGDALDTALQEGGSADIISINTSMNTDMESLFDDVKTIYILQTQSEAQLSGNVVNFIDQFSTEFSEWFVEQGEILQSLSEEELTEEQSTSLETLQNQNAYFKAQMNIYKELFGLAEVDETLSVDEGTVADVTLNPGAVESAQADLSVLLNPVSGDIDTFLVEAARDIVSSTIDDLDESLLNVSASLEDGTFEGSADSLRSEITSIESQINEVDDSLAQMIIDTRQTQSTSNSKLANLLNDVRTLSSQLDTLYPASISSVEEEAEAAAQLSYQELDVTSNRAVLRSARKALSDILNPISGSVDSTSAQEGVDTIAAAVDDLTESMNNLSADIDEGITDEGIDMVKNELEQVEFEIQDVAPVLTDAVKTSGVTNSTVISKLAKLLNIIEIINEQLDVITAASADSTEVAVEEDALEEAEAAVEQLEQDADMISETNESSVSEDSGDIYADNPDVEVVDSFPQTTAEILDITSDGLKGVIDGAAQTYRIDSDILTTTFDSIIEKANDAVEAYSGTGSVIDSDVQSSITDVIVDNADFGSNGVGQQSLANAQLQILKNLNIMQVTLSVNTGEEAGENLLDYIYFALAEGDFPSLSEEVLAYEQSALYDDISTEIQTVIDSTSSTNLKNAGGFLLDSAEEISVINPSDTEIIDDLTSGFKAITDGIAEDSDSAQTLINYASKIFKTYAPTLEDPTATLWGAYDSLLSSENSIPVARFSLSLQNAIDTISVGSDVIKATTSSEIASATFTGMSEQVTNGITVLQSLVNSQEVDLAQYADQFTQLKGINASLSMGQGSDILPIGVTLSVDDSVWTAIDGNTEALSAIESAFSDAVETQETIIETLDTAADTAAQNVIDEGEVAVAGVSIEGSINSTDAFTSSIQSSIEVIVSNTQSQGLIDAANDLPAVAEALSSDSVDIPQVATSLKDIMVAASDAAAEDISAASDLVDVMEKVYYVLIDMIRDANGAFDSSIVELIDPWQTLTNAVEEVSESSNAITESSFNEMLKTSFYDVSALADYVDNTNPVFELLQSDYENARLGLNNLVQAYKNGLSNLSEDFMGIKSINIEDLDSVLDTVSNKINKIMMDGIADGSLVFTEDGSNISSSTSTVSTDYINLGNWTRLRNTLVILGSLAAGGLGAYAGIDAAVQVESDDSDDSSDDDSSDDSPDSA